MKPIGSGLEKMVKKEANKVKVVKEKKKEVKLRPEAVEFKPNRGGSAIEFKQEVEEVKLRPGGCEIVGAGT